MRTCRPRCLWPWITPAIVFFAIIAIAIGVWTVAHNRHPGVTPIRFDSESWKHPADIGKHRNTRSAMVDDLLEKHGLRGRTEAEIISLLGPSDNSEWADASGYRDADFVYWLGLERAGSFSLDDEFLIIRLDRTGRVAKAFAAVN